MRDFGRSAPPPGVVATDGEQVWSLQLGVTVGTPIVNAFSFTGKGAPGDPPGYGLEISVDAGGSPVLVKVTTRFPRSSHFFTYVVPPGGAEVVPVFGAISVDLTNLGAAGKSNVQLTVRDGRYEEYGSISETLSLPTGAPGAYQTSTTNSGYRPPYRSVLTIVPNGTIDFQLIDVAGAQAAFFTISAPTQIEHPGHLRLQARVPAAPARSVSFSWRRV